MKKNIKLCLNEKDVKHVALFIICFSKQFLLFNKKLENINAYLFEINFFN
jgi:hypothetical protein